MCAWRKRGIQNIEIIVRDISTFEHEGTYDRVLSIEMFEVNIYFLGINFIIMLYLSKLIVFSIWKTMESFWRKLEGGWRKMLFCLFTISAIRHLLTTLRYNLMLKNWLIIHLLNHYFLENKVIYLCGYVDSL